MTITKICNIKPDRQDGAVSGEFLFSFNHRGECTVYYLKSLEYANGNEAEIFSEFTLDKNHIIAPHSNSVMFGTEYYEEGDEFPMLYTNIYNNYSSCHDKLTGVCLVYRVQRDASTFTTTLMQMIEIGFAEDCKLWKSQGDKEDARPYGNFVIDTESNRLFAFTMRDNTNTTRYFSFGLPKATEGEFSEKYGIKKVVLTKDDIIDYFDCPYHHFVQGATCHKGKIYSLEGFTDNENNPPAIRIINIGLKKEEACFYFKDFGTNIEPELIDFNGGDCYYTDHNGNTFKLLM